MRRYRVLVVKAGLDAHERGVHVVTRGLRDAGFEAIYPGLRVPAAAVARIAADEDVDAIGVSSLAGGHLRFATNLLTQIHTADANPVVVFGGVFPDQDVAVLEELGVDRVFRPGTLVTEMAATIRDLCDRRAALRESDS